MLEERRNSLVLHLKKIPKMTTTTNQVIILFFSLALSFLIRCVYVYCLFVCLFVYVYCLFVCLFMCTVCLFVCLYVFVFSKEKLHCTLINLGNLIVLPHINVNFFKIYRSKCLKLGVWDRFIWEWNSNFQPSAGVIMFLYLNSNSIVSLICLSFLNPCWKGT